MSDGQPRVAVIGTGGTISSVGRNSLDIVRYVENKQIYQVDELLNAFPETLEQADVVPVLPSIPRRSSRDGRGAAAAAMGQSSSGKGCNCCASGASSSSELRRGPRPLGDGEDATHWKWITSTPPSARGELRGRLAARQ